MRERYTRWGVFRDATYETDRKLKEKRQPRRVPPEVVNIVRHTPAHKPGVRDGRK